MELTQGEIYYGFKLNDVWPIGEISSVAHLFEHVKSKARLLYLKNDDDNKVFCVSFRTTPWDDCGTAHILEHSVLCGSKKYPLKEPFVELLKSSLNTFLNAMTYPDKTMYPVASRNEADLNNLIDVYCDAVFNPKCITDPFMFRQEGWHYHITNENEPLGINGVVYNEMKGALSDPEDIIERATQTSLYPNTSYAFESGGDPLAIPELSFEKYVEFYKKYYHPSNSYIYFYGDMDILPHLKRLDEEYLCKYEAIPVPSLLKMQEPFTAQRHMEQSYPVTENAQTEGKCYFALNYKIGDANDTALSYRFDCLNRILMDNDASPLKKALREADIADDIDSDYTTACLEPYYSIIAKNAKKENFGLFTATVNATLEQICREGIDEDIIKSAVNKAEFDLREADSGNFPKGLIFLLDIMESWLYDERPGIHLMYEEQLKMLRENENSDFYVELIKKYLLENRHSSSILLYPKRGGTEQKLREAQEKLANIKRGMSKEEISEAIYVTNDIIKRQSTPDSIAAKNSIPILKLSEISTEPIPYEKVTSAFEPARIHTHTDTTGGIVYVDINYDIKTSDEEEISALSLLSGILGDYPTKAHTRLGLSNHIGINLGDISFCVTALQDYSDVEKYKAFLTVAARSLESKARYIFTITDEIMNSTIVSDEEMLLDTVCEELSKFDSRMISSAQNIAFGQIEAMYTQKGVFNDNISGLSYYRFLKRAKQHLEKKDGYVSALLYKALTNISDMTGCDILLTSKSSCTEMLAGLAREFISTQPKSMKAKAPARFCLKEKKRIGIISPTDVAYTGMGTNTMSLGIPYNSVTAVAQKYLTSDYLWNTVRVMGGAYGAMMKADTSGSLAFVSYRDPHISRTLDIYRGIPEHLSGLSFGENELNKLIIGTFSDIDAHVQPYTRARRALYADYRNEDYEKRKQNRLKILSTSEADIRALGDMFKKAIENSSVCTVASEQSIIQASKEFDEIIDITKEKFVI